MVLGPPGAVVSRTFEARTGSSAPDQFVAWAGEDAPDVEAVLRTVTGRR